MLKKGLRLRTKEEFERVFRQGKPLFFGEIGCKIAKNNLGYLRVGFSLSKKHIEGAVQRNRLRRVISESILLALGKEKLPSFDVVFFTIKKLPESDFKTFASIAKSVVEYINK